MSKYNHTPYISLKDIFLLYIFVLIFSLLFRLLLPFGDEPDYFFRAAQLIYTEPNLIKSFLKYFYGSHDLVPKCFSYPGLDSIWVQFDNYNCGETLDLKANRWFVFIIITLPFLFLGLSSDLEFRSKVYICICSVLYPGLMYYLGTIGEEQIALIFSLWAFVYYRNHIVLAVIVALVAYVELSSAGILMFFLCYHKIMMLFNKKHGIRKTELLVASILFVSLIFGMSLLTLLPSSFDKATMIHDHYTNVYTGVNDKYPIILRPIITFMTATLTTPLGVKVIMVLIVSGVGFCYVMKKLNYRKKEHGLTYYYISIISCLSFILMFNFVVPAFSNAKYYIFILPFIMESIGKVTGYRKLMLFNLMCSFLTITFLFIYYI